MRRSLIALIFLLFASTATTAAECADGQVAKADFPHLRGGSTHAAACPASDISGTVSIEVFVDGEVKTKMKTQYDSPAYILSLDTDIRFDGGSTQGLGVSVGNGRDGTGMHYWKISPSGSAIDLGDAPALMSDKFVPDTYSTLVTSSGRYESVRYFYKVKNNHLVATRLVGFYAKNQHIYVAELSEILSSGQTNVISRKMLSGEKMISCQAGKSACW